MADRRIERKPWLFVVLTYVYAWVLWVPSALSGWRVEAPWGVSVSPSVLVLVGMLAPTLAALTLVLRRDGWRAVGAYLRQALDYHTAPIYLILALGLPWLVHGLSHTLARLAGLPVAGTLLPTGGAATPVALAIPGYLLMVLVCAQQEYGWRGYLQDALEQRVGLLPSSLLIGVLWGLWQLPLWFIPREPFARVSFVAFAVVTIGLSVVYAWLYRASGRKLMVVMVYHAMSVTAALVLPYLHWKLGEPELAYWIYALLNVGFGAALGVWLILEPPGRPSS
jgi:membrane protease YdiL (CAAX protease family)